MNTRSIQKKKLANTYTLKVLYVFIYLHAYTKIGEPNIL